MRLSASKMSLQSHNWLATSPELVPRSWDFWPPCHNIQKIITIAKGFFKYVYLKLCICAHACVWVHSTLCKNGEYRDGNSVGSSIFGSQQFCFAIHDAKGEEKEDKLPQESEFTFLMTNLFSHITFYRDMRSGLPQPGWSAFPRFGHYSNTLSLATAFTGYLF